MGAALTWHTSKAALVVMGNSIALYNPPVRVAEAFAMLDVMSGGRLVVGFPVGTSMGAASALRAQLTWYPVPWTTKEVTA